MLQSLRKYCISGKNVTLARCTMLRLEISQHECRHQISGHTTGAICWDTAPTLGKHLWNNVWQKWRRCQSWISIRFRQLYLVGLRERKQPEDVGFWLPETWPICFLGVFFRKGWESVTCMHKSTQSALFQAIVSLTPWGRVCRKIEDCAPQTHTSRKRMNTKGLGLVRVWRFPSRSATKS